MRPISIPDGSDPAALLQLDRRLRALARELVRDPGTAEDFAQESWLAALESGVIHSLPGWLATVVRRVALDDRRGARRRERREKAVARPEALPAAAEILEREEARRRVVEALLALEEPLRATLILRFLEELPPRAVAARMDVPVETVRSRTRRGLAVLRERLDRSFGDRASWCSALLFVLRRPSAAEALSTALVVMSIPKKIALVVLVCALGWLAWPRNERSAEPVAALAADAPGVLEEPPRDHAADLAPAVEPAERAVLPATTDGPRRAPASFGSLRVRVTWFDGTPAEGIAVYAKQDEHRDPELTQRDGSTDRSGIALFSRVPVGRTLVVLDRGMHAPATIEAGKEASLELVIPRGIDVLGRVENTEGIALSGAEVWLAWNGVLLDGTFATRSDTSGGFRLRSLSDQSVLGACATGYRPSKPESVSGNEGGDVRVRLVLWRGAGEVAGRIVEALTDRPVTDAFVGVGPRPAMESAEGTFRWEPWARTTRTDGDGCYRFIGVAPGFCSVAARKQGYSLARAELEVRDGRSETVDLALLAESALEGHVLDEGGRPVSGVSVVVGHGVDWLRAVDETSADGAFHIGALEADATLEARVYRQRGNGECIASTEFQTLPGQTFVWEGRLGQRGTIRGRVLDEVGEPLVDWIVEIDSSGGLMRTGPDGGFRFENLDQRNHHLMARALDSLFASLERTDVRPSEDELVLRVPRARQSSVRIVGVLLDERGRPIPGAEVWVGTGNYSTPARFDEASGAFSYGPSPPGTWRLYAEAPGRTRFFIGERELGPDETWDCGVVRLAPEGRVVARLLLDGAELGPELWLRIRDETRIWRPEGLGGTDPLVRSAMLPAGPYELVVLGGDYAAVNLPFEIRSGEETHLDVPIRRGRPALVAVRCDDPALTEVRLSISRAEDAHVLTSTLVRSRDGNFNGTYRLVPGAYRVQARAGERRAEGELVVGAEDADPPRLELALP